MTEDRALLLGFPESLEPSRRIADAANLRFAAVDLHRFPDGESRIRVPSDLPEHVVLCRSLNDPNPKLVELLCAADAARDNGARRLTLVAPYLCYMRQDKAFVPGEAVSQRTVGRLLAEHFEAVITVDPHLHRVHELREAVPADRAVALTAAEPMAHFLREQFERPILVGPDEESQQWVEAIAAVDGLDFAVAHKQRLGDRQVEVTLPDGPFRGRDVVLVDDMASTGRTLEMAAKALRDAGAASVHAMVTHALFVGDAEQRLREAGVQGIHSSDAIPHPTNRFPLDRLIAAALGLEPG